MTSLDAAPFVVSSAEAAHDEREILAELVGADFSALALTPQRSDLAPGVVRKALPRFAPWDSRTGTDLGGDWCVADHGDADAIDAQGWEAAFAAISSAAQRAFATGRFVVALGGDHSVTWPLATEAARVVRAQHGPSARLGIIQLDVHHDVRPLDHGPSNGTPMRGLLEHEVIRPEDLVQIGIHPFGNRRVLTEYCDAQQIRRLSLDEVAELGAVEAANTALHTLADVDAIYLTVDIDVLDRAFAPGTAAALPGGLDPRTLVTIVETVCSDARVRAMDLVEFDPQRDVADVTAYAAANVIMAGLAAVARRTG